MQRWFLLLFAAVATVSLIGTRWERVWEYVFGAPSPLWRDVVSDLQWLDRQALELGFFPLGLAVAITGFVLALAFPRFWGYLRRYDRYGREFSLAFQDLVNQTARQHFAWTLEDAYRTQNPGSGPSALRGIVDNVQFPSDFPPRRGKQLSDYVHDIRWPNQPGADLYAFLQSIFAGMLKGRSEIIQDDARYQQFLDARRVASKFWDDWARNIALNRLRYEDVARMFEANKRPIICLALSELAMASEFSLDPGEGKSWLFVLAQAIVDLDPRYRKRWFADVSRNAKRNGLMGGWWRRMSSQKYEIVC